MAPADHQDQFRQRPLGLMALRTKWASAVVSSQRHSSDGELLACTLNSSSDNFHDETGRVRELARGFRPTGMTIRAKPSIMSQAQREQGSRWNLWGQGTLSRPRLLAVFRSFLCRIVPGLRTRPSSTTAEAMSSPIRTARGASRSSVRLFPSDDATGPSRLHRSTLLRGTLDCLRLCV